MAARPPVPRLGDAGEVRLALSSSRRSDVEDENTRRILLEAEHDVDLHGANSGGPAHFTSSERVQRLFTRRCRVSLHWTHAAARSTMTSPRKAMYEGSCLCGRVRYEITGEIGDFGYCHCTSCRKASGTAHAANAPVKRSDFSLVSGAEELREFESSPGKLRVFCSRCGSPIYAYLRASADVIRIRLGSLDTPFTKSPKVHTWVSDKAPWEPLEDNLPQFPEWAPKSVLIQRGSRQP